MTETEVVGIDLWGYPYNKKYPPNKTLFPSYGGYETPQEEAFFNDFAVQGYDIKFDYRGVHYYCLYEPDPLSRYLMCLDFAQLSGNAHRYQVTPIVGEVGKDSLQALLHEMEESKTVNIAHHSDDPRKDRVALLGDDAGQTQIQYLERTCIRADLPMAY